MLGLLLMLAVIGVVAWLLITYVPMPAPFKTVITVLAVIFLIVILLRAVGFGDVPVPQVR